MLAAAAAVVAAVVVGDHVALRAAPERTAAQQAVLWKGDWLEVRGQRKGWLEVYDHRHERPGWIAGRTVRVVELDAAAAPALRAIVDFVRDTPGDESLGIAYAGLYLKVAPKGGVDAAILVAIGEMADRLGRRASTAGTTDRAASEQLEVAESWGIQFASLPADDGGGGGGAAGAAAAPGPDAGADPDGLRLCYDGAAYRQALALAPSPDDAAAAALALTDPACAPPAAGATARVARDQAALTLLESVDPTRVAAPIGDALRVRRAQLGGALAWARAAKGDVAAAGALSDAALAALARVDTRELADDDVAGYDAAAIFVGASRWASATVPAPAKGEPRLATRAGEPGETCLQLVPAAGDASPERCTHGVVWPASFRLSPDRRAAALAVEPLPGWLELWLFRAGDDGGWMVDVLAPTTDGPDLGYVELAGWSPDHRHALIVREARSDGAVRRSYQSVALATLAVDQQTSTFARLGKLRAWASAEWRVRTVALR